MKMESKVHKVAKVHLVQLVNEVKLSTRSSPFLSVYQVQFAFQVSQVKLNST